MPFAIAMALLSSPPLAALSSARASGDGQSARVMIGYESGADLASLLSAVERFGGRVISVDSELQFITVAGLGSAEEVQALLSGVAPLSYVEDDLRAARIAFTPDDPYYGDQWALQEMYAPFAWDLTLGSKDIVVAVVDTGVDYNHEDLAANMWTDAGGHYGYDFVNNDNDPMDDQNRLQDSFGICQIDPIYHGTHVAGIVGAVTNNSRGIAGLAQVRLMAVKVLDDCGLGYISDISLGIRYAADNGADVITLSLGGIASATLKNAAQYAWNKGVLLVAASGNDGGGVSYPAAYPSVVAVGSVGRSRIRSSFSNYGSQMELVAPGEDITSTMRIQPYYQSHTGTSQAAPQVAGVAALVLSRNPSLTNSEVRAIMNSTATDLGDPGWDNEYGHGLVNAYDAVRAALPGGLNASIINVPVVKGVAGSSVTLTATMRAPNGTAVPGKPLSFHVDSNAVGSAFTDQSGRANLTYPMTSVWGQHLLRVTFAGDTSYAYSAGSAQLFALAVDGGNISGVVMDAHSYERIAFASISLPGGRITLSADDEGVFSISGVPAGTRMIVGSRVGYEETYLNVTVEARRTTVVPLLLWTPGSGPGNNGSLSALSLLAILIIFAGVFLVLIVAFAAGRKRTRDIARSTSPGQIPQNVAQWLAGVYGIDPSRLRVVEVMPIADGMQMALMDVATGRVMVVRMDRYGRPVYMSAQSGMY